MFLVMKISRTEQAVIENMSQNKRYKQLDELLIIIDDIKLYVDKINIKSNTLTINVLTC